MEMERNATLVTSIKDDEHERRTATHTNLPNISSKEAEKFRTPTQFKRIMLKSGNKVRLQKLLKHRFKATAHVQQAKLIYCEGMLPRISLVEDRRMTLLSSKLKLTR